MQSRIDTSRFYIFVFCFCAQKCLILYRDVQENLSTFELAAIFLPLFLSSNVTNKNL